MSKQASSPSLVDEERNLADLTASIKLFRERRRKLTLMISKLVERRRLIEDRRRNRTKRMEKTNAE